MGKATFTEKFKINEDFDYERRRRRINLIGHMPNTRSAISQLPEKSLPSPYGGMQTLF